MIDVTGLPDGTYRLVQRVDPSRKIREAVYGNNASSVLVALRHTGAASVSVRVVAVCPDTATCKAET